MLIVIRHPEGVVAGSEYAKEVAANLNGKTQILNPRTIETFLDAVKAYKPSLKQHLILLSAHQDLGSETLPVEIQRKLEWAVVNKAGLVYGVGKLDHLGTLSTYVGPIEDNIENVAKNSQISTYRAIDARKAVGSKFVGRVSQDPHTVLFGFAPGLSLKASGIERQIITSLPLQWGMSTDRMKPGDWSGVGFLPLVPVEKLDAAYQWLYDGPNYVALGEKAHLLLEELEIEHGAVPLPTGNGMFGTKITTPNYGFLIRDVAKTHDIKLDWKP